MVSTLSIIAMVITFLICTIVPIVAMIIYGVKNKKKGVWLAWFLGAAGFFVMQIIIRTPILSVLSLSKGFVEFVNEHYVVYVVILAFTAALFEVVARYVVAKILKKKQCFEVAFSAGLGHGGIEAIVLIGMTYVNNLLYSIMINTGAFDTLIEQSTAMGVDANSLLTVKNALIETGAGMFLVAGYERILTMILHVFMTVLVFYFVYKKKDFIGIIVCLLIHTLIDFMPAFLVGVLEQTIAYIITYAFLTVMAAVAVVTLVVLAKKWKNEKSEAEA